MSIKMILFSVVHSKWPRIDTSAVQWEGEGIVGGSGQGGRADETVGGAEKRQGAAPTPISRWARQIEKRAYGKSFHFLFTWLRAAET